MGYFQRFLLIMWMGISFAILRFCLHFADRGVEVWINDLAWLFFISTDHLLFVLPNSFMYKSHLIVQSCGLPHCFCCKQSLTSYSTVIPDTQIFLLVGWWVDNKICFAYQIYSTLPNLDCNPEEEKKKKDWYLIVGWKESQYQLCN